MVDRRIGEIALHVLDLATMRDFYRDVIGLELMREADTFVFFRIADGFEGHTQVLALFDRSTTRENYVAPVSETTTLDHLAFSVSRVDFESEKQRLVSLGCDVSYAYHEWVQWDSLYVRDPEQNVVELVCYSPRLDG